MARKQTLPVSIVRKTWTPQEAKEVFALVLMEPIVITLFSGKENWSCPRCYHLNEEGTPHCDACKQSFDLAAWQERVAKREGRLV
jgi:hypothetical protein